MKYVFKQVKFPATKRGKCPGCGKRLTRSTTFSMTINPFNVNAKGEPRTEAEIWHELRCKAEFWKMVPPMCSDCQDLNPPDNCGVICGGEQVGHDERGWFCKASIDHFPWDEFHPTAEEDDASWGDDMCVDCIGAGQ